MASAQPFEIARLLNETDPAARDRTWGDFLHAYGRLLLHVAHRIATDRDRAMDAYAAVLEALRADNYRVLREYVARDGCRFSTWLVVVVRRLCFDSLRRTYGRDYGAPSGQTALALRRRLADLAGIEIGRLDIEDQGQPSAQDVLEHQELQSGLAAVLASLDPRDRLLIRLRFEDGLPVPRIANLMHFPTPFHAYRRLRLVLGQLRHALAQRGVGRAPD